MLTSSANQYLRPDHYLTPLPTTLDAKKSPLALLAQTCSQIGADPPSNKSLLSSLDKTSSNRSSKTAEQSSRDKSSPAVTTSATVPTSASESTKTSFKPYESCLGREKTCTPTDESRSTSSHSTSGRSRTPGNSSSSKRCPSNQSAASTRAVTPQGRKTATPNGEVARDSPVSRSSAPSSTVDVLSTSQPTVSSPSLQVKPAYSPVSVLAMADPSIKDLPLGTFKPGQVSLPASTAAYLGYSPSQLPIDVMANSLMSHHAALKNGINPYLYARLKSTGGPTAADGLMPICRDPFCTGCQLNSHLLSSPAPPPPPHPHATAGLAYFSPYSIYGSRLGATSGMHQ